MPSKLTRLDAVNRIIRSAGEHPVSSLSDNGVNDTKIAEDILDEVTLDYQIEAQNFNTIVEFRTPNSDGKITLPDAVVFIRAVGESYHRNVSCRGRVDNVVLFDLDNGSDVFSEGVWVEITIALDFEEMPVSAQFHVCNSAARLYQQFVVGDMNVDAMLRELEAASRVHARADDIRQSKRNVIGNSLAQSVANPNAPSRYFRRSPRLA